MSGEAIKWLCIGLISGSLIGGLIGAFAIIMCAAARRNDIPINTEFRP